MKVGEVGGGVFVMRNSSRVRASRRREVRGRNWKPERDAGRKIGRGESV